MRLSQTLSANHTIITTSRETATGYSRVDILGEATRLVSNTRHPPVPAVGTLHSSRLRRQANKRHAIRLGVAGVDPLLLLPHRRAGLRANGRARGRALHRRLLLVARRGLLRGVLRLALEVSLLRLLGVLGRREVGGGDARLLLVDGLGRHGLGRHGTHLVLGGLSCGDRRLATVRRTGASWATRGRSRRQAAGWYVLFSMVGRREERWE